MPGSRRRMVTRLAYLVLAAAALGNAGCLAAVAGAAVGGAAGYAYYRGSVCRLFSGSPPDVGTAARAALADFNMPLLAEERDGGSTTLESRNPEGERVRIQVEGQAGSPGEGPSTRVCIRVATFGDEMLSHRLLDQIGFHLGPAPPAKLAPVPQVPTASQTSKPAAPVETAPPPLLPPEPEPVKLTK